MEYPRPSWSPDIYVDLDSIEEKISSFTGNKKPFLIFNDGTCVFPSFVGDGLNAHCIELLDQVVKQSPDFDVSKMDDGSYLVSFSGPVYSLVLNNEYESNKKIILDSIDAGGLLASEKVLPNSDREIPKDHYYIGLFARARLYNDVANKKVARYVNVPDAL